MVHKSKSHKRSSHKRSAHKARKTHRSKSYRRRHTRKNGGACPCNMRLRGGRGGLGGAEVSRAYTTGASQELAQITGKTPGLSN
jgi:hypothetical protein